MTRTVIIANGHLLDSSAARRHIRDGDRIICADGGANHAVAMGLVPHVVVGDLDSLAPDLRAYLETIGVHFEVYPVLKDKTDLELALRLAIAEGADEVNLLATMGGRLDQSLANLLLLTQAEWAEARVRVIEGDEVAWIVRGGQHTTVTGEIGDTLSLIPITYQITGVWLDGVQWPLHDATLHLGDTLTVSNTLSAPAAHLQIGAGLAVIVHRTCQ
jgi:thiamine pyrophosphokinase